MGGVKQEPDVLAIRPLVAIDGLLVCRQFTRMEAGMLPSCAATEHRNYRRGV
jgi:hypothetical protein